MKMQDQQHPLVNSSMSPEYRALPLRALRESARRMLARYLDLEGSLTVTLVDGQEQDVVTDYIGLAELAGFDTLDINHLKRHPSPTMRFLEQWHGPAATVGRLWDFLLQLERYDVIEDCRRRILYDCEIFLQSKEIAEAAVEYANNSSVDKISSNLDEDETVTVSIEDVKYRKKTLYHAFVSYTDEDPRDREFVKTLIRELEFKRGLSLFVPGRNDLPGPAKHTVAAYLIEKRCRRVIILLSDSYTKSDACNFQMKFTHALSPDARKRKLIPVVRDSCVGIPSILKFISICDFSKEDEVDWTWVRLFMALYSPIDEAADAQTDFSELENSLKDVPIPLWRPLSVFETERYSPERPSCLPVRKPEELDVQTCSTNDSMTAHCSSINHADHISNEMCSRATETESCDTNDVTSSDIKAVVNQYCAHSLPDCALSSSETLIKGPKQQFATARFGKRSTGSGDKCVEHVELHDIKHTVPNKRINKPVIRPPVSGLRL